jgi:hypothetical protein
VKNSWSTVAFETDVRVSSRLDKVLGISKSVDSYESGPSLASRICKIEGQVNARRSVRCHVLFSCIQVDNLDVKVDRLCQLASSLLERSVQQQRNIPSASPISMAPVGINRNRSSVRLYLNRRRQRVRRSTVESTAIAPMQSSSLTSSTVASSRTPAVHVPSSTIPPTRDYSRDSLISLYWLFQDHVNSSRTPPI